VINGETAPIVPGAESGASAFRYVLGEMNRAPRDQALLSAAESGAQQGHAEGGALRPAEIAPGGLLVSANCPSEPSSFVRVHDCPLRSAGRSNATPSGGIPDTDIPDAWLAHKVEQATARRSFERRLAPDDRMGDVLRHSEKWPRKRWRASLDVIGW